MSDTRSAPAAAAASRWWNGDLVHSFRTSPVAVGAALIAFVCLFCAVFAPWVAPHNPFDLRTLELSDACLPPAWMELGSAKYLLGTDDQGRDILSAVIFGARISRVVGLASVMLSVLVGVSLGLVAGFRGGWVQYARTVRGCTLVERNKEYVQAARVTGVAPLRIMRRHVLPNVMGPVLVLATIQVATAIITEATLSFLGAGSPPTAPSLGTLIRIGNNHLFSGEWWITVFPGAMLVLIALSVNLLGDWLRDALNPRLR